MNEIKLSIILPVYNGGKTLNRTLDSIKKQKCSFNYEVIIINDNSEDDSLDIIKSYLTELPIHLLNVNLDVHCAGNSRNLGLDCALGEWITFIDQDDEFEDNAFQTVMDIIESNHLKYICCTLLYEYNENTGEIVEHNDLKDNIDVWLHGKYYHKNNLLRKYNLRFKQDLKYLEDLYFNSRVIEVLFKLRLIYKPTLTYYITKTYKWYEHDSSTHSKLVEGGYVFNHWGLANHYFDCVIPPLIEMIKYSENIESEEAIIRMAFADLAYVYVNYNVIYNYYDGDTNILSLTLDSVCRNLPEMFKYMKITNVFDLVNPTISTTLEQAGYKPEEYDSVLLISFAEWWGIVLTSCSY